MNNLLDQKIKNEVIKRVNNLDKDLQQLWGKMNMHEMLCHCADQMRMALGILKTEFVGNIMMMKFAKHIILLGMPAPKGKVETVKELKQSVGGTKPTSFNADRQNLLNLISEFNSGYPSSFNPVHPAFGELTKKQWGRLTYLHLDHHLKQFGK